MTEAAPVRAVIDAAIRWAQAKELLLAAHMTGEPPDMADYVRAALTLEHAVQALPEYPRH